MGVQRTQQSRSSLAASGSVWNPHRWEVCPRDRMTSFLRKHLRLREQATSSQLMCPPHMPPMLDPTCLGTPVASGIINETLLTNSSTRVLILGKIRCRFYLDAKRPQSHPLLLPWPPFSRDLPSSPPSAAGGAQLSGYLANAGLSQVWEVKHLGVSCACGVTLSPPGSPAEVINSRASSRPPSPGRAFTGVCFHELPDWHRGRCGGNTLLAVNCKFSTFS